MTRILRCGAFLLLPFSAFAQGDLDPPGPPGASMRTLEQVEPRIPVNATNTPGDNTFEFIIGARGSYYLTGNIVSTKPVAIYLNTGGVTLDLNGFSVIRAAIPGGRGILISGGAVTVRNGFIRGWETGITSADPNFSEGTYERLVVTNCTDTGIVAGKSWLIDRCTALNNTTFGIRAGVGSRISNCISSRNGAGILAEESSIVDCTVSENSGFGINGGSRSTISRCTAERSGASGIRVVADSVVQENRCVGNGALLNSTSPGVSLVGDRNRAVGNSTIGNARGIVAQGRGNLIEGNHVRGNTGPGIEVTAANGKNVIIRNVAGDNVNSYTSIAAGNDVGPIGSVAASTHPLANVQN